VENQQKLDETEKSSLNVSLQMRVKNATMPSVHRHICAVCFLTFFFFFAISLHLLLDISAASGKNAFPGPFNLRFPVVTTFFKGMPPIVD